MLQSHLNRPTKFSFFIDYFYSLNFCPLIYHFTISFSAFPYSLDVFSHFHRFITIQNLQYLVTTGVEPRIELQQPAGREILQFCIYTVKGYCYAINRPILKILFFQRFFHTLNVYSQLINHFTISLSVFQINKAR